MASGQGGPVTPGSISQQQQAGTKGAPMTGQGSQGQPQYGGAPIQASDVPSYYSAANPFTTVPRIDESDSRQDRYLNDRMGPDDGTDDSGMDPTMGGRGARPRPMRA